MHLIEKGLMQEYRQFTGHYYTLEGKIIEGDKRGRLLGFPTANIEAFSNATPPAGIYAVIAEIDGIKYKAVANLGYAPTFDRNRLVLEVHIFDFSGDIYGKEMKVHFVKKLRNEKKFSGAEDLIEQIKKDVEEARRVLSL